MTRTIIGFLGGLAACVLLLGIVAAKWSPTARAPALDVYYPRRSIVPMREGASRL